MSLKPASAPVIRRAAIVLHTLASVRVGGRTEPDTVKYSARDLREIATEIEDEARTERDEQIERMARVMFELTGTCVDWADTKMADVFRHRASEMYARGVRITEQATA